MSHEIAAVLRHRQQDHDTDSRRRIQLLVQGTKLLGQPLCSCYLLLSTPAGVDCMCCRYTGKRDATALAEASWNGPGPGWMEQLGALGSANSDVGQHNNVRHGITTVTSVT